MGVGCVEVTCELQAGALEEDVCFNTLVLVHSSTLSSTNDAKLCGFGNDSFSDVPLVGTPHLTTTSSERQLAVAASKYQRSFGLSGLRGQSLFRKTQTQSSPLSSSVEWHDSCIVVEGSRLISAEGSQ